jgi:hypothetical protein
MLQADGLPVEEFFQGLYLDTVCEFEETINV